MNITIAGRIPSKKNSKQLIHVRGRPVILPSKEYAKWHRDASWQLKRYKAGMRAPLKVQEVSIAFYAPDKRDADCTNKAESIMDLLVDNGILVDDNWFEVPTVILRFIGIDKTNPRAEVVIS